MPPTPGSTPGRTPPASPQHLIFLHGAGVGPWMWRHQREHFGDRFTVHTPTLPGHDPRQTGDYSTHDDAVRSIAAQVNLTSLQGEVTVVGFSMGGQVAIELASRFPQIITRTAVISSLVTPWRLAPAFALLGAVTAPLSKRESFARKQAAQLYIPDEDFPNYFALSRSISSRTISKIMTANFSFAPSDEFLHTTQPVLLVAGAQEQRVLITGLERLASTLPNSRFEIVEGVGHGAPLATPDVFNSALQSWLQKPSDVLGA
ncbi:MAG TPA: alpha/beta hydrolase [Glaciihabitans sp.]|nr:alpha/beta hydrolase [Glaciihabitans sp.]